MMTWIDLDEEMVSRVRVEALWQMVARLDRAMRLPVTVYPPRVPAPELREEDRR